MNGALLFLYTLTVWTVVTNVDAGRSFDVMFNATSIKFVFDGKNVSIIAPRNDSAQSATANQTIVLTDVEARMIDFFTSLTRIDDLVPDETPDSILNSLTNVRTLLSDFVDIFDALFGVATFCGMIFNGVVVMVVAFIVGLCVIRFGFGLPPEFGLRQDQPAQPIRPPVHVNQPQVVFARDGLFVNIRRPHSSRAAAAA